MNLLKVSSSAFRLYSNHLGWHLLAGFSLLLFTLVALGLVSGGVLASMLIAEQFGSDGQWVHEPLAVLGVGSCWLVSLLAASAIICSALGAFVHICAQIGAGVREITILGFLEYARKYGTRFWLIGLLQLVIGCVIASPFVVLTWLLAGIWGPLSLVGFALAFFAFFLAQWPFWLAYSAQVVDRQGITASLGLAFKTTLRAPITSVVALVLMGLAAILPAPMFIFYPLYYFFIFAPLSTDFTLVYYEMARGLLK